MINITVINAKSDFEKNLVINSVKFAKEHCHVLRPLRKLKIVVELAEMDDDHGWVWQLNDREFEMQIASNCESIREFVSTIMHETCHISQYIEGGYSDEEGEEHSELNELKFTDLMWERNLI